MSLTLEPIHFDERLHSEAVAGLWTGACGAAMALSPRFVTYNTRSLPGVALRGQFAWQSGEPVGFIIASTIVADSSAGGTLNPRNSGWINAVATMPESQGQGIAKRLLQWAEMWLLEQGCQVVQLGGDIRPFVPGLPVETDNADIFHHFGFRDAGTVWDVSTNLASYMPPLTHDSDSSVIRPAQAGDMEEVRQFMAQEFPGRWSYQFERFLEGEGRISDLMILRTARGIDGFCHLTFEDSKRPLERYYPYQLPRPWGQVGPIGISNDLRGEGYGSALLDRALRRLHNNGVNGCVIDWTTLLDFYARFGFKTYREYVVMEKELH